MCYEVPKDERYEEKSSAQLKDHIVLLAHPQKVYNFLVTITLRKHLYPSRTQKLSSIVPKILAGYPAGKIGSCQILYIPQ